MDTNNQEMRDRFNAWLDEEFPSRNDRQSKFQMTGVGDLMFAAYMAQQPAIESLTSRVSDLEGLSVTNIMVDVVPGEDGMGEEVYAKSLDDVFKVLNRLSEQEEELSSVQAERDALRAELESIKGQVPVGVLRIDPYEGHVFEPAGDYWPIGEPLYLGPVAPAQAQESAQKVPGWISVEERLPEERSEPYQVIAVCTKPLGGQYKGKGTRRFLQDWVIRNWPQNFTHWMEAMPWPLPPAPTKENNHG